MNGKMEVELNGQFLEKAECLKYLKVTKAVNEIVELDISTWMSGMKKIIENREM